MATVGIKGLTSSQSISFVENLAALARSWLIFNVYEVSKAKQVDNGEYECCVCRWCDVLWNEIDRSYEKCVSLCLVCWFCTCQETAW